jgi:hypothetical protein
LRPRRDRAKRSSNFENIVAVATAGWNDLPGITAPLCPKAAGHRFRAAATTT